MSARLDPIFHPKSIAYIGGRNLQASLRYQRDIGFGGKVWIVNSKYKTLEGYPCVPQIKDLPEAPDVAYVAVKRESAVEAVADLRARGCRAVICVAAGFAEVGGVGTQLQEALVAAAGDMPMLGPNVVGMVNFLDPMAAIMENCGVHTLEQGVAVVSQGGTVLCDAAFSDRSLPITHLVGGGNQATTGIEEIVEYLLDDPRVRVVGLSFETIRDISTLRRAAAKALRLGKPIVAIKFGKTEIGAQAAASHTASMAGSGAAWEALLDRLGIVSTDSEAEFFETLKLFASGQVPQGRRAVVISASGVLCVMLADHLSTAGFELPQPTGARRTLLRELLPVLATPGNPLDTPGVWNDKAVQSVLYSAILDEGYDVALLVVNFPRPGTNDITDYLSQAEALADAARGRDMALVELAPLSDCFPADARDRAGALGIAAMQGLEDCMKALTHAVWWRERRAQLVVQGLERLTDVPSSTTGIGSRHDEATAKALLSDAGISVPVLRVATPEAAHQAATEIGYPVAVKALDSRLLHKSEAGAVRTGLTSPQAVQEAIGEMRNDMQRLVPTIPLTSVLVEAMACDVVAEVMASVTCDPSVGTVMLIAGGGVEAELWNDSTLLAAPFGRQEIARALDRLKVTRRLDGWRGRPGGDREALLDLLENLASFAHTNNVQEVEINPILVGCNGAVAVDAILRTVDHHAASEHNAAL